MSEYTDVLERIGERAPMPEPALDRMVGRRERQRRNRRISAGALGLAITILLVLALLDVRPRATQQPAETPTPAAANGWIAYTLAGEGIFLVQEGQASRLAIGTPGDDAIERCPRFSPDGTHLAFTRGEGAGPFRTFVADVGEAGVVAGSARFVARSEGEYWACPSWSPDGTKLLYTDLEGAWAVGTEQDEPPSLLWRFGDLVDIGWSPDGTQVAAMSRDGTLWVVSAQDGSVVLRTSGLHNDTLSWSPSGDRIVVGHGDTGFRSPPSLITVETGEREDLTAAGGRFAGYGDPHWSPDGTAIALLDHRHEIDEGIVIVRPDEEAWYRIPLPALQVRDIWALRWSPDGRRLLVASGCSVYSIPAEGGGWALVSSPDVDPGLCQTPPGLDWQPVFP
jgi:Tol biopolymer transport system component